MNEEILKIIEKIKSIFGESIFHEKNKKQLISAVRDFCEDEDDANFLVEKINNDNYADKKSVLLTLKFDKNSQTEKSQNNSDVALYLETIKKLKAKYADLKQKYKTLQDDFDALKNSIPQNGNYNDNYEKLRNYLRSIVEVKQETFRKFGLKLTNFGFSSIDKDSFYFDFVIEGIYKKNLEGKINIYNRENQLLKMGWCWITCSGFDSFQLFVNEKNLILNAKRIVVFAGE